MTDLPRITRMPTPDELSAIMRAAHAARAQAMAKLYRYRIETIGRLTRRLAGWIAGHHLASPWLRYPF